MVAMDNDNDVHFRGRLLTVAIFILLSLAGFGFALYLFWVATTPYMMLLAVGFTFLALIACFFNIYAAMWYYRSFFYDAHLEKINKGLKPMSRIPTVAVVIPTYNEEAEMVDSNIKELLKLDYPRQKLSFYLADDSTDIGIRKGLEEVAKKYRIQYVHREDRKGFKAGAINNVLENYSKEEFIAIFDSDERLIDTHFLTDLLPYFQDEKLSYVQTEKRYMKGNFFSDSVDIFDAFFFRFIQPARAMNNTAVFAGSCGVISRKAFDDIGGFPEYVIEDTFFSFESDGHGYKSLYVPKVYARGRPVKTFTELAKQQWRYNYGDTQFISYFYKKMKMFSGRPPMSKLDYCAHGFGLNYLSVALILFTLVSVGIVFSTVPFAHINFWQFIETNRITEDLELFGFCAFSLSLLTPVFLTKAYFKSWSKGFMVFLLNYALAFVRTKAALATLIRRNPGMNWNRLAAKKQAGHKVISSLYNTKTEIAFAATMFGLAYLAWIDSNVAGGLWLGWYGVLYSLTTIFLHKYG